MKSDDRNRLVEILQIRKIAAQNQHRYLPVQLLIWGNVTAAKSNSVSASMASYGPSYGLELAANDAVKKLTSRSEAGTAADPRTRVGAARVPAEEVEALTSAGGSQAEGGP